MLVRPPFRSITRSAERAPYVLREAPSQPAPKLGAELIVNGDFSSPTGWTPGGGWSIVDGVASASAGGSLSRTTAFEAGKRYMVAFTMTSRTSGNVQPQFSGGSAVGSEMFDSVGRKHTIIEAASGNHTFSMKGNSSVLSVDDISVREILQGGPLTAMGDSLTLWVQFGLTAKDYFPSLIEGELENVKAVNLGVSGNTTGNMVARLSSITSAPYIMVIYGGTNDAAGDTTVAASPAPTATTFSVGSGKGTRYAAGAKIRVNGILAEVQSVSTDAITLTEALAAAPTAGDVVKLDTAANLVKIGEYAKGLGCTRVLIIGRHFDNWASGTGDTVAYEQAANAGIRAAQREAAEQLGAVYVDLYAVMRDLIQRGEYEEGDDTAWHVSTGNLHLNATGQQLIADAMRAVITQRDW